MNHGTLVYKCRNCGGLDRSSHVPDAMVAIVSLLQDNRLPTAWSGPPTSDKAVHLCGDGNLGVADLVGVQVSK